MYSVSFDRMARLARRSIQLTQGENLHQAIVAVSGKVNEAANGYLQAFDALRASIDKVNMESKEASEAIERL